MKSLTAIGFLILLLYQLIVLPLAVLTFEQSYESAAPVSLGDEWKIVKLPISLPYTDAWENPDGQEGLVRDGNDFYNIVNQHYANDTLYTLLKTNQNARERFFDLADQLQQYDTDQAAAPSPVSRLLKLLKDRLTTYLLPTVWQLTQPTVAYVPTRANFADVPLLHDGADLAYSTPPPEK